MNCQGGTGEEILEWCLANRVRKLSAGEPLARFDTNYHGVI
jgi:hypothetical protein